MVELRSPSDTSEEDLMPTISRFFGITIQMYWNDHAPPHFHAKKGSTEWVFGIRDGEVIEAEGRFSKRDIKLIWDWIDARRAELLRNWELARKDETLNEIAPL